MQSSTVLSLFVVILLCADVFCDKEPVTLTPDSHSCLYCFRVKPTNLDLIVTVATLPWGKWIRYPPNFDEIEAPTGQSVKANEEMIICSAGRDSTPSGTQGEVQLSTKSDKQLVLKITWDVPYWSGPTFDHFYQESLYQVTRSESQYGHTFTITKKD